MEEARISVDIPRSSGDEPNLLVAVNGRVYLLPRGKASLVPPEVAAEIARARRAMERMDESRERMLRRDNT